MTWEIVVMSAFCELGDTKYEAKISNKKTPDLFFSKRDVSLIGDIFTVSDDQQHKKNPVEDFSKIVGELWREFGPTNGSFSWRVESIALKPSPISKPHAPAMRHLHLSSGLRPIGRGSLTRLLLPPVEDLRGYLSLKVSPFFKKLALSPTREASLDIDELYAPETRVCFSIKYSPEGGQYSSGSYPSYTTVSDIERHVLWRRLTEKRDQFANATEEFPRLLFVCDGGCAALRNSSMSSSEYRFQEILDHFWRRPGAAEKSNNLYTTERNISAIIGLSVESNSSSFGFPTRPEHWIKAQLYPNPYCQYPLDEQSIELLNKVVSKFPVPIGTPSNVMRAMDSNSLSSRRLGVFTMNDKHVEMSAVELLRILSGELSVVDFCRDYQLETNPFKNALMKSQTIKSIRIEDVANRDDNKVIIDFGVYDVAIGPFRVKKK